MLNNYSFFLSVSFFLNIGCSHICMDKCVDFSPKNDSTEILSEIIYLSENFNLIATNDYINNDCKIQYFELYKQIRFSTILSEKICVSRVDSFLYIYSRNLSQKNKTIIIFNIYNYNIKCYEIKYEIFDLILKKKQKLYTKFLNGKFIFDFALGPKKYMNCATIDKNGLKIYNELLKRSIDDGILGIEEQEERIDVIDLLNRKYIEK